MNYGKKVCESLKRVRKQIADANDIPYEVTECKFEGNCKGTCPKCESELRYIDSQLSMRRAAGMAVTVVGLSLGAAAGFSSCTSCNGNSLGDDQVMGEPPLDTTEIHQMIEGKAPADADYIPVRREAVVIKRKEKGDIIEGDVTIDPSEKKYK